MNLTTLIIGILIGKHFNQKPKSKHSKKDNKTKKSKNTNNTNNTSMTVTKNFEEKFKIKNKSGKPITPEDIEININTGNQPSENSDYNNPQKTEEPNFIPLTIFWAHYQAHQRGLLKENKPAPWEIHKLKDDQTWIKFFKEMVDKDWKTWINNKNEVKKRSLETFKKIR